MIGLRVCASATPACANHPRRNPPAMATTQRILVNERMTSLLAESLPLNEPDDDAAGRTHPQPVRIVRKVARVDNGRAGVRDGRETGGAQFGLRSRSVEKRPERLADRRDAGKHP